jgi:hypothetical protein
MTGRWRATAGRGALTILIILGPPLMVAGVRLTLLTNMTGDATTTLMYPVAAYIWIALFIAPAALLFPPPPPAGPEDSDDGGGGGRGPDPGPRPDAPVGGIPLPDAEQARARRRDHRAPLRVPRTRRVAEAPNRRRVPHRVR